MAIKIFDTVLASGGRHYIFADTDVLFLRPWAGLFTLPTNGANAVFMLNPGDAYCISPLGYLANPRLGLPRRLNSGLCVLRRSSYDLDFFEWLIRSPAFRTRQAEWLIDQTVWAAAAYRMGLAFWSESNVAIAAPGVQPAELVAGHFAGGRRKFIQEAAKLAATAPRPAELAVPLVESERLSRSCCSRQWVMLKWNRGRDRMSRLLNRGGGAGIIRG